MHHSSTFATSSGINRRAFLKFCTLTASLLALPPGTPFLLFAFYGIFMAATEGVEKSLVADLAPKDRRFICPCRNQALPVLRRCHRNRPWAGQKLLSRFPP